MKKGIKIVLIALLSLFINCSEDTIDLLGEGVITGRVVEAISFSPIENAKITLSSSNNTVFTDVNGYFKFDIVEEGDYSISATKEGYLTSFEPATVSKDAVVNIIFEMEDDDALNKPPSTPILYSPEDGIENQELSVEFVWGASDPDLDEIKYTLELKNDQDNELIKFENLTDTIFVASDLKYGVKYFWQVTANDDVNEDVLSPLSSFTTRIDPENRFFYVEKISSNNVIYSSGYNEADGIVENKVQLTSENINSWRPRKNNSSNLIAFLRTYNNETHLFTMNLNGADVRQVTSQVPVKGYNLDKMDFSWSSNGDRLLYPHYDKLYVINKDGSGLKLIYQTSDGSFITECDWSNDESIIALKTNDITGYNVKIYTIDLGGNILTNVLSDVKGAAGGINISVDNKLLLYSYDVSEFENFNGRQLDSHIYIYNFISGETFDLSQSKESGTNDLDPRFSPNEAEIIFENTSNDNISTSYIYKSEFDLNSNDDDRTQLFENARMPDWE